MAKRKDKIAIKAKEYFDKINQGEQRVQWEFINQKGYDFSNDNQLSAAEKNALEEQGMPTFTINRIIPVVEMLNFYATANQPRWQAVGVEGSDSEVASVFSDIADYIWYNSNGNTLLSNAVNDAVTKSMGFLLVTVDPDSDQGMGDVVIQQPDPFDVYIDPKSRDSLFRDASFIMIRKILPKSHLINIHPDHARKIKNSSSNYETDMSYSQKSYDNEQHDFHYKDVDTEEVDENDKLIDYMELYEKHKVPYMNVFYSIPPDPQVLKEIQMQVQVQMQEMEREMSVQLMEQEKQMRAAVEAGQMLPERYELEMQKAQKMMQDQLVSAEQEAMSKLQAEATKVENTIMTEKEFKILSKGQDFQENLVEAIRFHQTRIKLSCVIGDTTIYSKVLPLSEYPIIPFHYKWTGTPYPMSAVSPLIGKQRELNKAHQLMVHNASLGSSLRWIYEEGAIDTDYWERYSSAPGALLPKRPGFDPPQPVLPFQLNNAFFGIVQEGKGDMEYLAGIYSSMQGDTGASSDMPYRGMLAMDEYGTRRIKYWLKNSIEPALKQTGELVKQYSQAVYTANKVFRIVQPNAIQEEKEVEINIPIYNDMGEAIGKWKDYGAAKFDVRIISGSTLPVNRWAYLEELKQLMQLGVVDDIAVLAETDIKNKDLIAKRQSLYSQLKGKISDLESGMKDRDGTIETLERQLVQAGIKNKVMQGAVEVSKQVQDSKSNIYKEELETKAEQRNLRNKQKAETEYQIKDSSLRLNNLQKNKGGS